MKPCLFQHFPVIVIDFITMSVPLGNLCFAIERTASGMFIQYAWICTKTECSADVFHIFLIRHQRNQRMQRLRMELDTVRIVIADHIPGKGNDRHLHAQADTKIGDILSSRIVRRKNHSLRTTLSESARYENSVHASKLLLQVFLCNLLRVRPSKLNIRMAADSAVLQCFHHTEVGIVKLGIFSYDGNLDFLLWMTERFGHFDPVLKIRLSVFQMQAF